MSADTPIIRLEYFHDDDPEDPKAWQAFQERWEGFDPVAEGYKTVVCDSQTFMAMRKRNDCQFRTMKKAKDPRRWYAETTDAIERCLMGRWAGLRCNVVLICHVSQEKDEVHGSFVFNPMASGRLAKGLPAGYSEVYHAYVDYDKKKQESTWHLQTVGDNRFSAATQIQAPDGCEPDYEALWEDWPAKKVKPIVHTLVYGDFGSKKSFLAASFPKPILVQMFDPIGKENPYLSQGEPDGIKFNKRHGIYVQNVY